jgi:hypothetical protein
MEPTRQRSVCQGKEKNYHPNPESQTNTLPPTQAFHWFATSATLHSLHRTLQAHGALGLIWNIESYNAPASSKPSTTWEKTLQTHTLGFDDSQQRFRNEKWRDVFLNQVSSSPLKLLIAGDGPLFSMPLGEEREEWTVWLTREQLWERYRTLGQVAVLEGEELEVGLFLGPEVLFLCDLGACANMFALVQNTRKVFDDALTGSDVEENEKGQVALHGATYAFWTTKIPAEGKDEVFAVSRPGA